MKRDGRHTSETGDRRRMHASALVLLLAFWLSLVVKAVVTRYLVLGSVGPAPALLGDAALIAAVLLAADALVADKRGAAFWAVSAALSLAMAATVVYQGYFGQIPTPELLGIANQLPTVKDSLRGIVKPAHALYFADLAIIAIIAIGRRTTRRADATDAPARRWNYQHVGVYAAGVLALVLALGQAVAVARLPQPVDGLAAAEAHGILPYQVGSVLPLEAPDTSDVDPTDTAAVAAQFDRLRGLVSDRRRVAEVTPGVAKGSHVVLVQVESLQASVIGLEVEGRELTPNLNRLARESYYFPKTFTHFGAGNTADVEFAANTSLYPPGEQAASVTYGDKAIPSLPTAARDAGYSAVTFHANTAHFWNRSNLYGALGFTKYYDSEFFGDSDALGMGASDRVLFDKSLAQIVERDRAGEKVLAELITLSTHRPFDALPADWDPVPVPDGVSGTETGRYLQAMAYIDREIGRFLEGLDREGLADKTVLVLYGDHFGLQSGGADAADGEAQKRIFGRDLTVVDMLNVPLFVRLPGQTKGRTIEDSVGIVDVAPTIADLIGIDLGTMPRAGESAFVEHQPLIGGARIVPVGTYIDNDVVYLPAARFEDGAVFSAKTSERDDTLLASEASWRRMREMLALGSAYLEALPVRDGYRQDADAIIPGE